MGAALAADFYQFDPARYVFGDMIISRLLLSNRPRSGIWPPEIYAARRIYPGVPAFKSDYSNVWEHIPMVYLRNIGVRDWKFLESDEPLKAGGRLDLPEFVARKYAELYKKEFSIEPFINELA